MLKEFRDFAMRGNVLDLAIGVIIGGAFGAITKSLVDDIIMPPIGLLLGNTDFTNLFLTLKAGAAAGPYASLAAAQEAGAVTLNYGLFLNTIINFIIIAFAMFLVVRAVNRMEKKEEAAPAEPSTKRCGFCFTEIPIQATRCPNCTSELLE
ncbi:MAG: large conductance mechanosensitive channel protein MscL [Anaerolineales bacterium]|nr:large conductance mechanosensitive channel protein MscL [Anaerolineales bacterium]